MLSCFGHILLISGTKNKHCNDAPWSQIHYGITDNAPQCLGLNPCTVIAKYYIYTALKNKEDYFLDVFLAILKNKIQIETSRAKLQVKL